MLSHATQIQAFLAREREDYARWTRTTREMSGAAPRPGTAAGGAKPVAPDGVSARQAGAAERGGAGASARA